ncbi:hypothetical protein [Desmonostoc muscorum]|nr:hypothetical protein [Desmonostoc muscorum]
MLCPYDNLYLPKLQSAVSHSPQTKEVNQMANFIVNQATDDDFDA